jgi:hypothetical protein
MNLQLAKKQGIKKVAIDNIKSLHKKRDEIIDLLKATDINSKEYLDLLSLYNTKESFANMPPAGN